MEQKQNLREKQRSRCENSFQSADMIESERFGLAIDHSRCADQHVVDGDEDEGMLGAGRLDHTGDIARLLELNVDRDEQRGDVRRDEMPAESRTITRSRTTARLEVTMSDISLLRMDVGDTSARIQAAHRFAAASRAAITGLTSAFDCVRLRVV